jgi:hypothetical protein
MTSLTGGNCSSTLCNIIIGSLVGMYCILLCELTMCSSVMIVVYMNFSDMDSKPDRMYQTGNI